MSLVLTVVAGRASPSLDPRFAEDIRTVLWQQGARTGETSWLSPERAFDLSFEELSATAARAAIAGRIAERRADFAILPAQGRRKRLLVADLESTVIENELLDDLAGLAGMGERIAAITARAMRGELDFASALRERVAMLAGQPAALIERAKAGIRFTPGARTLVATMRAAGAHTALVSGGFRVFTGWVRETLRFDTDAANTLEVADGKIVGRVKEPILAAEGKAAVLLNLAQREGIPLDLTLAVGDGANDVEMVSRAGLGVAFHGKPVLRERAAAAVEHGDLTTLLFFQGFHEGEFVS
jgi:phosphoserine phosphatase